MSPQWRRVRLAVAIAILALVAWRVGAGPFAAGLRRVDGSTLAAALLLNAVATASCAWRWRAVAGALGVRLPFGDAITAYYRAQFLNTTLPGGVVGDVHRAVASGRSIGDVGLGVRAVVWERGLGQAVQVLVAVGLIATVPSPVGPVLPWLVGGSVAVVVVLVAVLRSRSLPVLARLRQEARALLSLRTLAIATGTSALAVGAHLTTFVLAARATGNNLPVSVLLPMAALVLLAMTVPLSIAGWGPREGVAASVFAAAGSTAAQGVAVTTCYGVVVLAASLPGALVLLRSGRTVRPSGRVPAGSVRA